MKQMKVTSDMLRALESLPDAKSGAARTVWTKERDDVLRAGWTRKRKCDVAKLLRIHENTCRKRARELGIV